MTTRKNERLRARRCRGDEGAGLVEFALISVLLLTLAFGIINFGLILSFDQDVTRIAAEGARAGAVAMPVTANDTNTALNAASAATAEAVKGIGGSRFSNGCTGAMHCETTIISCPGQATVKCVQVKVWYDYEADPIYGDLPIMSSFLPNKVQATSVARINQ